MYHLSFTLTPRPFFSCTSVTDSRTLPLCSYMMFPFCVRLQPYCFVSRNDASPPCHFFLFFPRMLPLGSGVQKITLPLHFSIFFAPKWHVSLSDWLPARAAYSAYTGERACRFIFTSWVPRVAFLLAPGFHLSNADWLRESGCCSSTLCNVIGRGSRMSCCHLEYILSECDWRKVNGLWLAEKSLFPLNSVLDILPFWIAPGGEEMGDCREWHPKAPRSPEPLTV